MTSPAWARMGARRATSGGGCNGPASAVVVGPSVAVVLGRRWSSVVAGRSSVFSWSVGRPVIMSHRHGRRRPPPKSSPVVVRPQRVPGLELTSETRSGHTSISAPQEPLATPEQKVFRCPEPTGASSAQQAPDLRVQLRLHTGRSAWSPDHTQGLAMVSPEGSRCPEGPMLAARSLRVVRQRRPVDRPEAL